MPHSPNGLVAERLVPVWLVIGIVFALLIGVGAGILAWLSQDKVPTAILKGGAAFGATLTVVILVISLLLG